MEKLRIAEIEQANGLTIGQVCQKLGITEKTYFLWREKYGGMKSEEARRLKELELENERLKRIVADLVLDNRMLREVAKNCPDARASTGVDRDVVRDVRNLRTAGLPSAGSIAIDTSAWGCAQIARSGVVRPPGIR